MWQPQISHHNENPIHTIFESILYRAKNISNYFKLGEAAKTEEEEQGPSTIHYTTWFLNNKPWIILNVAWNLQHRDHNKNTLKGRKWWGKHTSKAPKIFNKIILGQELNFIRPHNSIWFGFVDLSISGFNLHPFPSVFKTKREASVATSPRGFYCSP